LGQNIGPIGNSDRPLIDWSIEREVNDYGVIGGTTFNRVKPANGRSRASVAPQAYQDTSNVMPEQAFVDKQGVVVYYDDNGDLMYFDENDEAQFYEQAASSTKIIQPTNDGAVAVAKNTYIWDDWFASISNDIKKLLSSK
jgi:hypothetical protein